MFDLAWSEIALIAVVALIVIGPKNLPDAIKGVANMIQKGKKMLRDFQSQADDLVKEANLQEVRNQIHDVRRTVSDIRNFDLKGMVDKTVDPDGTLKNSLNGMDGGYSTPAWTPPATAANTPGAPAMIPPNTMAPYVPPPAPPVAADLKDAPAFLPPSTPAPAVVTAPVVTPAAAAPSDLVPPLPEPAPVGEGASLTTAESQAAPTAIAPEPVVATTTAGKA